MSKISLRQKQSGMKFIVYHNYILMTIYYACYTHSVFPKRKSKSVKCIPWSCCISEFANVSWYVSITSALLLCADVSCSVPFASKEIALDSELLRGRYSFSVWLLTILIDWAWPLLFEIISWQSLNTCDWLWACKYTNVKSALKSCFKWKKKHL